MKSRVVFKSASMKPPIYTLQEHLAWMDACADARQWAGSRTATEAWEQCERADWLLWWAARTKINSSPQIVLAACDCARLALRHVPVGEDRPRLAIEAAERWVEEPSEVNRAAWAAAVDAAGAAAGAAAVAAVAAAGTVVWATAWAAGAAVWAAGAAEHRTMCALIRNRLTQPWRESETL